MSDERYSPINGFSNYIACNSGYIINVKTGNLLYGSKKKTGYYEVSIRDDYGEVHTLLIHRVIASCFCEREDGADEVNHKDGDKSNNESSNLEWVTHGQNLEHAFLHGLRNDDVSPRRVIATNRETGEQISFESIYKAARFLGISQGNICIVLRHISW